MEKIIKPRGEAKGRRFVDEGEARTAAREILAEIDMEAVESSIAARIQAVTRNMRPDIEQEVVVRPSSAAPFFEVTTRRVRQG
jgi:hypothetical protein